MRLERGAPIGVRVDAAKLSQNLRGRGTGFDDGARIFEGRVLIWEDQRRDYGEERFRALGETAGDVLHVAFTWRSGVMRIISARGAPVERKRSCGDEQDDPGRA